MSLDREERELQEQLDPVEREVPFYLRIELYLPVILIGGLIVAILIYARGMYGAGVPEIKPDKAGPGAEAPGGQPGTGGSVVGLFTDPKSPPLFLYASPTTRSYLAKVSANQEVLLKQWREYLKEHKRAYKEVNDPKELAGKEKAVIIVPSALALDDAERKALAEHSRKGGSILATGAFGARDGNGEWLGWGLMEELFAAKVADELAGEAERHFLVMTGGTPLTAGFSAGARAWVGKSPENPLRFEGGQAAARLMDWARTADGKSASVVYGEKKGGGRWVLYGFSENGWDAAPTAIRTLSDGALDWLQRTPKVVLAPWPKGFAAAYLVSMNVDDAVENAADFAASLDALKLKGTFFVVADVGARSPDAMKALAAKHEIAYHGDAYEGFKDQPEQQQERRLKAMREKPLVTSLLPGSRIAGFRAPGESADSKTEQLLLAMDFQYLAADPNRSDGRLPFMARVKDARPGSDLVILPRTQSDDVLFLTRPNPNLEETVARMKNELEVVVEQGGLGVVAIHSRNFAKESLMAQAVPTYLLALAAQQNRVWIATGSDLAQWWRLRENMRVSLQFIGQRMELEISNVGDAAVEGATAVIYHPRAATVKIDPTKAWMPDVEVRRIDDFRSLAIFKTIRSGHYPYKLVFE
jgi:peptidoglycan/xylan/chitin deacetylase (PgdA/CDA1 family)